MPERSDQRHCPHVNDDEDSFWCCRCERAVTEGWTCQDPGPCQDDTRAPLKDEFGWRPCPGCDQVLVVSLLSGLGSLGQRHCKSCSAKKRADRLRADATAGVILEGARKFKARNPAEWAEMMAAAGAGTDLSDAEAWELLTAIEEAEVEALRRVVEGEA